MGYPNPPAFKEGDSRSIKLPEFEIIQALTRTFTLDAFADDSGLNTLCETYCSPKASFFLQSCTEAHVWVHPPFSVITQTLNHYFALKGKSPRTLSACFLLPHWPGATWSPLLQGMQKLTEYPAGYPLFDLVQPDGHKKALKGIPWPISVYYDPPYDPVSVKITKVDGSVSMQFACTTNGASALATADSAELVLHTRL